MGEGAKGSNTEGGDAQYEGGGTDRDLEAELKGEGKLEDRRIKLRKYK